MRAHKTIFILIIILFASCEKKISELDFEKKVMTELLPSLIDSTCIDTRIMLNFPPEYGESIFDKSDHYIGVDSTKVTKEEKLKLLEWKKNKLKIENDTSKIIIAFDPKIKNNTENQKDAIGDIYVVLTILANQLGLDIDECIDSAYNEIKDRTGKNINGSFIKD